MNYPRKVLEHAPLLCCPFCGHGACLMHTDGDYGYYPASAYVMCMGCMAKGPTVHDSDRGPSHCNAGATIKWNLRWVTDLRMNMPGGLGGPG